MAQKFKNQIDAQEGIKITNELYDGSNAAGTSGQVLSSTGTGTQWIDSSADTAERIEVTVKNVSGGSLSKGTVVHASPTATPPSGNVIEVIAADYDTASAMPAIGVLNETIANEAEGAAVMMGAVSGIDTDSFNIGDELYVGNAGAFTNSKPTANNQLIQKMAVVIKKHASNGLIKIFGAGRSNDVPNQIDRNVNFTDNSKLTFGDSTTPDLEIYHDTGNSVIKDNGTGSLYIMGSSSIRLTNVGAGEHYAKFFENGAVELMYDNSKKFETTSAGVSVTGDITFGDSSKAIFGAGNDLQIFHNAVDSYSAVIDSGTGYLLLGSDGPFILIGNSTATETYIKANNNGSVDLHYDNSKKLETTTYGINVISKASINDTISGNFTTNYDTRVLVGGEIIARSLTANESMVSIGGDSTSAFVKSGKQDGSLTARDLRFVRGQDEKLRVTSTGIDVTGDINIENTTPSLKLTDSDGGYTEFAANNTDLVIKVDPDNVVGSSTIQFEIDGSEYMRIATTGNVGIGTTSPDKKLEVSGDIKISGGDYNGLYFENASGTTKSLLYQHASYDALVIKDIVNNADRFTFTNSGNLGIGTTSPAYKLDITGNSTSGVIAVRNSANGRDTFRSENASGTRTVNIGNDGNGHGILLVRGAGGTTTNYIAGNGDSYFNGGDVGIGTTSPGAKLDVNGDAKFSDNITMTKSSGNNQLYMNSSGGGAPVIYMEDPSRKWGQYVSSGHLHFKDETANIVSLKIDGATSAATFAGSVDVNGSEITVGTNNSRFAENNLRFLSSGTAYIDHNTVGQSFVFRTSDASSLDTTALTIASNGNATFAGDITLEQAATPTIELKDTTNNYYLLLRHNNTNAIFDTHSSSYYEFKIGDSEKMRINNNGNVGIATTSPNALLEISGIRENQIRLTSYDTTAAVDETIGGIEFYSSDTGNEGVKASISAIAANTEGSAYMTFSTGTNTERMRIDSSGNLGIGTSSPDSKLDVTGGDITVNTTGTGFMNFKYSGSQMGTIGTDGVDLKITANADLQILPTGNVGIGTTTPSNKLEVNGNIAAIASNATISATESGGATTKIMGASVGRVGTSSNHNLEILSNNIAAITIDTSQNSTFSGNITASAGTITASGRITGASISAAGGFLNGSAGGIRVHSSGTKFFNITEANAARDNIMDIGASDARFKDLYLGGNIQAAGNVGIGVTSATHQLHVHTATDNDYALRVEGSTNNAAGVWTGIGIAGESANTKSAIIYEDIGVSYARGKLHFCINNEQNQNSASPSDAIMTISNDGNVGIGTTSPNAFTNQTSLTINGTNNGRLDLKVGNAQKGAVIASANEMILDAGASPMQFYTGNTLHMLINTSGNVGIGTTSPNSILHVGSTGTNAYSSTITKGSNMKGIMNTLSNNADDMVGIYFATGSTTEGTHWSGITGSRSDNASHWGTQLNFYTHNNDVANLNDATQKMVIKGDGKVGIGTDDPDARFSAVSSSANSTIAKIGGLEYSGTQRGLTIKTFQSAGGDDCGVEFNAAEGLSGYGSFIFAADTNERMRIDSSGNVQLQTVGAQLRFQNSVGAAPYIKNSGEDASTAPYGQNLEFYTGGSKRMVIKSDGTATLGNTNPESGVQLTVRRPNDLGNNVGNYQTLAAFQNSVSNFCQLYINSVRDANGTDYTTQGMRLSMKVDSTWMGYMQFNGSGNNGGISFGTGTTTSAPGSVTERMRIDSGGNVGIGVTPFTHGLAPSVSLDLLGNGGIWGYAGATYVNSNAYYDGGWKYKSTNPAATLQVGGSSQTLTFRQAASGTADGAITYTEAFRVHSNGNVGIGTTSPSQKLHLRNGTLLIDTDTAIGSGIWMPDTNGNPSLRIVTDQSTGSYTSIVNAWGNSSNTGVMLGTTRNDGVAFQVRSGITLTSGFANDDGSTRFIVKGDGNVGVGTSTPAQKLDVRDGDITTRDATNTNYAQLSRYTGLILKGNGSGSRGVKTPNTDALTLGTNNTERMRITSGGNVELKPTDPVGMAGTNTNYLGFRITQTNSQSALLGTIYAEGASGWGGNLIFSTKPSNGTPNDTVTERMRITSGGSVGIGTTNPSYTLHVVDTIGTRVLKLGHGVSHARITTDDASKPLDLQINSQNALRIATNKDIGIGDDTPSYKLDVAGVIRATGDIIAFSDKRVKENIKTIENSLDKVDKLRGVEFNKIGEDKKSIGVIAQEIEEILPEVVSTDDDGMKSVAYGNITGVLIEAIKELKAEVEELKKQIK